MDILTLFLLLLAGCAAGFVAGFFGVGGAVLMVPALLYVYQAQEITSLVSTHLAFGTTLLVAIFASASSAYKHHQDGFVVRKAALTMGAAGFLGALAGAILASAFQGKTLRQVFAVVVFIAAIQLLMQTRKPKGNQPPDIAPQKLLPAGFFVGFVSALAGYGGGVFSVPILYSLFRYPLKKAVGTSSAIIVACASAATAGYAIKGLNMQGLPGHTLGFVDYLSALPLIVGSVPLAVVGARLAEKTKSTLLRKIFATLLVVVAARMFLG